MVSATGASRDEIKAQLLEMVKKHLDAASTYDSIEEDKKMELKTTMGAENGIGLTVTKVFAKGITVDEIKEWFKAEDMMNNQHKVDSAISGRKLEDLDGLPLVY